MVHCWRSRDEHPSRRRSKLDCWKNRDELISDVLQWTPSQGGAKAGRPARTYMLQLCADTGWSPGDRPKAMDDSGQRGSEISVLIVRHDDDDDDDNIQKSPRLR